MDLRKKESILLDFDVLFDTEIGVCSYLYINSKKEFFKDIDYWSYDFFRYSILTRKEENPLTVIFKDEYKDSLDSIYNDLFDSPSNWEKVLKFTPSTDVLKIVVSMIEEFNSYHMCINCKNETERRKLKLMGNELKFKCKINEDNYSNYSSIYKRNIKDLVDKRDEIEGKSIYLYNYSMNYFNRDMTTKAISELAIPIGGECEFKFIDPYKNIYVFDEEGEEIEEQK